MFDRRKMAISVRFRLRPLASEKPYHRTHQIQLAFDALLGQKQSIPVPLQIRITVEGQEDGGFYLRWPEDRKPDPKRPWQGEVVTANPKLWDQKEQKLRGRHADIIAFNDELRKTELFIKNVLLNQQQQYKGGTGPKPTVKTVKEEYMTGQKPGFSLQSKLHHISPDISLVDAYDLYRNLLLSQKGTPCALSANTLDKWRSGLNYLIKYLTHIDALTLKAKEVNRNFLKRFHLWLLTIPAGSPKQIHLNRPMQLSNATDYATKAKKVFEYLIDEGITVDAGILTLEFPRDKPKDVYYLAPEHLERLFALKLTGRIAGALWWMKLMCLTGLDYKDAIRYVKNREAYEREGEEGKKIVITRNKPPKNECHIYMLPELHALLEEAKTKIPKIYFPNRFNDKAQEIATMIGFERDFTSKICRKTAGNLMLRSGFSMAGVAGIMGHSSVNTTTKYYVKTDGALVDEEYRKLVIPRVIINQPFSQIYKAS
ncbi:tyrosine-type recombinase/integrase [Spirosoma sp. HMF4905]|uniref:Tyrosine-type recombinase/integrase n=1 Tax=Spirosoma arboris TaxID=2682092 RepID=A0A7K1SQZ6_9BACT|nr:phage integrase SAM-like domain-containing protein [Spirosoma arboris]MVM36222.1 tyrosine-type recombinase/integrase [Spirosoma arboris]